MLGAKIPIIKDIEFYTGFSLPADKLHRKCLPILFLSTALTIWAVQNVHCQWVALRMERLEMPLPVPDALSSAPILRHEWHRS